MGFAKEVAGKRSPRPQITDMCGRYASFLPPEFLARLFATVNPLPNLQPTWNLAPTDDAPVVRLDRETGARHLDVLKWGLIPYFTKDLKTARHPINARSDTVARSGMFKAAFAERRCLVPATAYYEWRDDPAGKTPFAIARLDGEPVAFGGIWEHWESADGHRLDTFATITTEANQQLSMIQPRMPVIIEKADWPVWLGEVEGDVLSCSVRRRRGFCAYGWPISASVTSRIMGRNCSRWATWGRSSRRCFKSLQSIVCASC